MSLFRSLRFILQHPLNRRQPGVALRRWLRWQLGSRLVPGPVLMPLEDVMGLTVIASDAVD